MDDAVIPSGTKVRYEGGGSGSSSKPINLGSLTVGGTVVGSGSKTPFQATTSGPIVVEPGGHVGAQTTGTIQQGRGVTLTAGGGITIGGTVDGGPPGQNANTSVHLNATGGSSIDIQPTGTVTSTQNVNITTTGSGTVNLGGTVQSGNRAGVTVNSGGGVTVGGSGNVSGGSVNLGSSSGGISVLPGGTVTGLGVVNINAGPGQPVRVGGTVNSPYGDININPKASPPGNVTIDSTGVLRAKKKVSINADTLRIDGTIICCKFDKKANVVILGKKGKVQKPNGQSLITEKEKIVREQSQEGRVPEDGSDAQIRADDYVLVGSPGAVVSFVQNPLSIAAQNQVQIVTGPGGLINLTGNLPGTFVIQNPGVTHLKADQILLDPGVMIETIVGPGPVITGPSALAYEVCAVPLGAKPTPPESSTVAEVALANFGNQGDSYQVSVTDSLGWSLDPPPALVSLPGADDDSILSIGIEVPLAAGEEDTNRVEVTIQSVGDPSITETTDFLVVVRPPLLPQSDLFSRYWFDSTGAPGDSVVVGFWLGNDGEVIDTADVTITDSRGWVLDPAALTLPLAVDDEAFPEIGVKIPMSAAPGDTDVVTLTARSRADTSRVVTTEAYVVVTHSTGVPGSPGGMLALYPNAPNPYRRSTVIRYTLPRPLHVRLAVVDVSGRLVRVLAEGARPAGTHGASWDARDQHGRRVAPGVYLSVLEADGRRLTRRMVVLR